MNQPLDISQLLTLRKLTRAVADHVTGQLRTHLTTIAPLINPRNVFGQFLRSTAKQSVKGETEAFEEVKRLYAGLAGSHPFNLRKDLESPLDIVSISPEITPVEYACSIPGNGQGKEITITSPLKWVLSFSGSGPKRLRELLAQQKTIVGQDLQQCVLNYLVLHVTLKQRPGVVKLLEALRFRVTTGRLEGLGELPVTNIECPIATSRPADDVILQSTEISGMPAFEEVVNVDTIESMADPFRDELLALVKT